MHWPALMAWYLAGILGNYLAIELAGFVGAYSSAFGMLLLPVAVLIRVISSVAMFLVLRDGLRHLSMVAPLPVAPRERRRTFFDALLVSIVPFFALYAASGMLRDDVNAYSTRALEVQQGLIFQSILDGTTVEGDAISNVTFNPLTVSIVIVAFVVRWLLSRYAKRLPKLAALASVYLEAAWVFFTAFFIANIIDGFTGWVSRRVASVWLSDMREWFSDQLVPVAWIWDFIEWALGALGGVLLEPLAWLAIAGVIYGQAIAPERLRVQHRVIDQAQQRYSRVPGVVRQRLNDIADSFIGRFRPVGRSLLLMWRSGPLLIAGFVLAYTAVRFIERVSEPLVMQLFGAQDLYAFWMVADALVFVIVSMLIEPLRIVVIAVFYDQTLGNLRAPSEADSSAEPEAPADPVATGQS